MSDERERIAEALWQAEKDANQSGAPGYGETWQDEPVRHLYRAQAETVEVIVARHVTAALNEAADAIEEALVIADHRERSCKRLMCPDCGPIRVALDQIRART